MLEFQEGFFEQEVRDGFYLDATMKTVWAAELEVLQRVAEVCARHGIQWYAAYGTLMGAIRHEGFVPWDDDMDIWVMRKDYNRLMTELLPKELPKDYIVQSALNEAGYDQFHSCVINGSGIDITPDRLKEYHGCPFTVCLDIFPLDYLPRNEGERDIQKNLVELAGRAAMLAKELGRGDYDEKDEAIEQNEEQRKKKQGAIDEIMTAIEYLENFCSFRLDRKYIEENDWRKVASELWRCANYVAMMYGEEDADYIVEYLDFDRWPYKKFPKSWFAETYSATFENFMVPIPCGYNEMLYLIYGSDFYRHVRNGGCHEYPFYKRQLVELRRFVANSEKKAIQAGIADELDSKEEREFLQSYDKLCGSTKKKVLMANDPLLYKVDAEGQLKVLEKTLALFKEKSEEIILWWRPHPVLKSVLSAAGNELGKRYEKLLDDYKAVGWGICDETTNTDRAVKECDIYYGDMNAVVQPFQNAMKPVLMKTWDAELAIDSNADRSIRLRGFISYSDFCKEGQKKIFANTNYNALIVLDEESGKVERFEQFPGDIRKADSLHCRLISETGKYLFVPVGNGNAHVMDSADGQIRVLNEWGDRKSPQESWETHYDGKRYLLLPPSEQLGLWSWTFEEESLEQVGWWQPGFGAGELVHGTMDENLFYSLERNTNRLSITNVSKKTSRMYRLPDEVVGNIAYDGQDFWYTAEKTSELVQWNAFRGVVKKREVLPLAEESSLGRYARYYLGMYVCKNKIFMIPQMADKVYVYDIASANFVGAAEFDCDQKSFSLRERTPFFKEVGSTLLIMFKRLGVGVEIDSETLQASLIEENCALGEEALEYQKKVLCDRAALMYEVEGEYDFDTLCRYLTEK